MLRAQKAVQTLAAQAQARGARLVQGHAIPEGEYASSTARRSRATASCGAAAAGCASSSPSLVQLRVTLQELFFFDGGPAWRNAPAWVDYDRATYGTGDLDALGVKVAWDHEGPPLDPDADLPPRHRGDRASSPAATSPIASPRSRRRRWPAAKTLPLRALGRQPLHRRAPPRARVVWIVGGGSGHGFKHGPAMAERIAAAWDGGAPLPPHFALGERAKGASFRSAGSNF